MAQRLDHGGRYLLTGAGCAVIANGIIIGLDLLGVHYVWGSLVAVLVSGSVGYASHCRWTFYAPMHWRGWLRFMLGLAGGTLWSLALFGIGVSLLGLPVAVVVPVVTVLVTAWNYLASRWAITGGRQGPSLN